jgi:hypothetical protein
MSHGCTQMTPIALMSRSEEMSDNSSGIFDQRAVGPVGKRGWRVSYSVKSLQAL